MSGATHIGDDGKIVTNQRTLAYLLGLAAACAIAWATVRAQAASAERKAETALASQAVDHDEVIRSQERIAGLIKTVEKMDGKVDELLRRSIPMNAAPALVTQKN